MARGSWKVGRKLNDAVQDVGFLPFALPDYVCMYECCLGGLGALNDGVVEVKFW